MKLSLPTLVACCALASTSLYAAEKNGEAVTAATKVYAQLYTIEDMQKWCETEAPSSSDSITQAVDAWKQKHAALLRKVPTVLKSNLSEKERMDLAKQMKLDSNNIHEKLASAPKSDRESWCTDAPTKIAAPEMGLMDKPEVVNPLTNVAKVDAAGPALVMNAPEAKSTETSNKPASHHKSKARHSQHGEDARACLDLGAISKIRACAEKYR